MLIATLALIVLVGVVRGHKRVLTVGFLYDNDETTPYSYSFYLAQKAVQETYGDRVQAVMICNVQENEIDEPVRKLVDEGCDIIFTNSYGDFRTLAERYPDTQFCQTSNDGHASAKTTANYHTFKGEIYQARYTSGVVAGLKLQEMIDRGAIEPKEALVGFVGALPYPEVVSGFTAFILGVRSVVPEATLRVKYTNHWNSYILEKACATELLQEGCVIISQHCDTIGPAIACEEFYEREAYHVGYNIDMTDVAPNTSLTSCRINWTPYVIDAVKAVMDGKDIEGTVAGTVHPHNDMSAGFNLNWVELTSLNASLLPHPTQGVVDQTIAGITDGSIKVFKGDYVGINPDDSKDTIDLRDGYVENEHSSIASFGYLLQNVVTIEE